MTHYVAFDLETTGLDARSCEITEVGAIRFTLDEGEVDRFQQLAQPRREIPPIVQRKTGITPELVAGCRPPEEVIVQFLQWLQPGDVLVAHNAPFDAAFVVGCCREWNIPVPDIAVVDTMGWSRERLKELPNHQLSTVAAEFGPTPDNAHRALEDAQMVAAAFAGIASGYKSAKPAISRRAMSLEEMASFHTNPGQATKRQLDYLEDLGCPKSKMRGLSRKAASRLIDEYVRKAEEDDEDRWSDDDWSEDDDWRGEHAEQVPDPRSAFGDLVVRIVVFSTVGIVLIFLLMAFFSAL